MKGFTYFLILMSFFQFSCKAQDTFEFVVLPDTQTYVEEFPDVYMKQMEWISGEGKRFSFVLHVGDITQNNSEEEWAIARKGFSLLDGKTPYNLALGNHDMGSEAGKFADTRNTTLVNSFFPLSEYIINSNTKGTFPENTIDNSYAEYDLIGEKWLVLSLEFGPRNKTVDWANAVIKGHPNHHVIINTHAYLFHDNTLLDGNDWSLPQNYGIGKMTGDDAVNDGGQLWDKMVKKHKNVLMVFTGHIAGSGVGQLVSQGDNNNTVYQMLANFQKNVKGVEKGDSGYLRIIKVDRKEKTISVKTYSPWLDTFNREPAHEFVFEDVKL